MGTFAEKNIVVVSCTQWPHILFTDFSLKSFFLSTKHKLRSLRGNWNFTWWLHPAFVSESYNSISADPTQVLFLNSTRTIRCVNMQNITTQNINLWEHRARTWGHPFQSLHHFSFFKFPSIPHLPFLLKAQFVIDLQSFCFRPGCSNYFQMLVDSYAEMCSW